MKTKILAAALALAAAPVIAPQTASAQQLPAPVIGIVDIDRLLRECTACVAANTSLQAQEQSLIARRTALQTQLQNEGQPIQTELQRIQGLSGAARSQAETALRPRLQAFEASRNRADQELQQLAVNLQSIQANVGRQIQERLGPIYQTVMNNRRASVLLPAAATLARAQALDVTTDVLTLLNQQLPSVSLTPLPAQPGQQQQQPPRQPGR